MMATNDGLNRDEQSSKTTATSYLDSKNRIRISDLQEAKRRGEKWTMLTSYDTVSAKIFDRAGIPCLLVGDSAAQTVYGYKSTLPVTVDELIPLARAVSSSCERALVIADLPFGSYQESPAAALRTATRFMKEAGAHGVKLEGGRECVEQVKLLARSGIPVMAHIGFTPQSEHALSGFKVQARSEEAANRLLDDAISLENAGAFACVLEMISADTGGMVTEFLKIPTVGIGAGPACDAQVLVWQDMAGFSAPKSSKIGSASAGGYLGGACDAPSREPAGSAATSAIHTISGSSSTTGFELERVPKFVKRYANLGEMLYNAAIALKEDVRSGAYPAEEHCYK